MIALLLKNLGHHGLALTGATALLVAALFFSWALVLIQGMPTLMTAGTSTLYYLGPFFFLYVSDRFVAVDRNQGTSEFLAALPLGFFHRVVLPWVLGFLVIGVVCEGTLLSTALLASRREGVPLGWLAQLHVQVGLFALAWHSLAFGIAHTGRYRLLVWWLLIMGVTSLEGGWVESPWRTLWVTAPLADPLDHSRSVLPWSALLPLGFGTTLGLTLTLILDGYRGGALPARWYAPSTARQRAAIVVLAMLGLGLSGIPSELAPERDAWHAVQPLPAEHAVVRYVGRPVEPIAREVAARLDVLGALAGVDRWPGVVLYPTSRGLHRHVRRAVGEPDENVVVLVDPTGPRAALVREVVHEVLLRQTADLGADLPGVDTLLAGLPGLDDDGPALAARLGQVEDGTLGHRALLLAQGRDLAEAVAVARIAALEPETRASWARSVLGKQRGEGVPSLVALRFASRGLAAVTDQPVPVGGRPGLAAPTLLVDGEVRASVPAGAEVLDLLVLDPLQPLPGALDLPRPLPVRGRDELTLSVDPTQAFAVRARRYDPDLAGFVASAWAVR